MGALDHAVRSGKALYAGISSYSPEHTARGRAILRELGTPLLIHQPSYSMLNRWIEDGLLDVAGGGGRRLHRVLPAGPGHADRPLPGRHPGRLAGRARASRSSRSCSPTRPCAHVRGAERDRRRARPVAGAAGAGLGAARPAGDLGADRREQRRAAGGQPRRGGEPGRSPTTSWPRSTSTPSRRASTSGPRPARPDPPPPPFEENPPQGPVRVSSKGLVSLQVGERRPSRAAPAARRSAAGTAAPPRRRPRTVRPASVRPSDEGALDRAEAAGGGRGRAEGVAREEDDGDGGEAEGAAEGVDAGVEADHEEAVSSSVPPNPCDASCGAAGARPACAG